MTLTFEQILLICNGILITVAGYFIRQTMERLAKSEQLSMNNAKDIELLKQEHTLKHQHLTEKFDQLKDSIDTLTGEIKALNTKIDK